MLLNKRLLILILSAFLVTGASIFDLNNSPSQHQLQAYANVVKDTYESKLFSLSPYKQGHFGLRMYRQTQDEKYYTTILVDLANVTDRLNQIAADVTTPKAIRQHSLARLNEYKKGKDERSQRRYAATKNNPDYFYMDSTFYGISPDCKNMESLISLIKNYAKCFEATILKAS